MADLESESLNEGENRDKAGVSGTFKGPDPPVPVSGDTGGSSGSCTAKYDPSKGSDVEISASQAVSTGPLTPKSYINTWFKPPLYPKQGQDFPQRLLDSYFPLLTRRFRYYIVYIVILTILWSVYGILYYQNPDLIEKGSIPASGARNFIFGATTLFIIEIASFIFTFANLFRRFYVFPSILMGPGVSLLLLVNYYFLGDESLNYEISGYTASVYLIILMYTALPLPLTVVFISGATHSIILEILSALKNPGRFPEVIFGRVLLQIFVNLIGVYLFLILQIRRISLFQKMHQATVDKHVQEENKVIKERIVHSLMPASVANNVIDLQNDRKGITFRPFNIDQMKNVSILFADIVGFTRMSSNKTAEHLVALLSDLFGRFDDLCEKLGCEKISTLGDCYYCVSGCPEPNKDHARCCVEMGLGMIKAIQEFDSENNEEVNMRVGVHTGVVLCGIVGSKRFKFDVWSHDVTLANTMESTGQPGRVHISQSSYGFLEDEYEVEQGEDCEDNRIVHNLIEHYDAANKKYTVRHQENGATIKTYFIIKRKNKEEKKDEPVTISVENEDKAREDSSETDKLESENLKDEDESNSPTSPNDSNSVSPAPIFNAGSEKIAENFLPGKPSGENGLKFDEIAENLRNITSLVENPPMHPCTLSFDVKDMEEKFHQHSVFEMPECLHIKLEIIVSFGVFVIISICCFVMLQRPLAWNILFPLLLIIEIFFVFKNIIAKDFFAENLSFYSKYSQTWFLRSIEGTILAAIPVIATFSNFSCKDFIENHYQQQCFLYIFISALFNLTTLTTINSMIKSFVAVISTFVVLLIHILRSCSENYDILTDNENISEITTPMYEFKSIFNNGGYLYSIDLDLLLPLILILFLNRECEISYRISYHCDAEAISCQDIIRKNRNQIECLLHNIIPEHISSKLIKGRYSKNHQDIGVIFAGLVNFNDLYEESFEGGREMLRVLNELVGDYEELLDKPEFKDVEKIKTITSTFMAAAGLDEKKRNENKHPNAHLFNMMRFAIEMQRVIEHFNESMINFEFILNIGFNFGEVTAGVIGTTKLLFDIWGDTVNVSSRMYSNGASRRIQVPSSNIDVLSEMFEFEYRGTMEIKGKGQMGTYLLVKQKDGATWS